MKVNPIIKSNNKFHRNLNNEYERILYISGHGQSYDELIKELGA
jgi:hypothetical protein